MHHLPKPHKSMDEAQSSQPKSEGTDQTQIPRKLERRNVAKKFNYTPSDSSSTSPSTSGSTAPRTRSLDSPNGRGLTSFRTGGKDGDVDWICLNLGLSGPEDFDIPKAAYELMKNRSSSDVIQRSKRAILASINLGFINMRLTSLLNLYLIDLAIASEQMW